MSYLIPSKSIIKQNILSFLEKKAITRARFYRMAGITRGILNQNNGLSEENILKFLNCFKEVEPHWLLTGDGPMERQSEISTDISARVNAAPDFENGIPLVPSHLLSDFLLKKEPDLDNPHIRYKIPVFCKADFLIQLQHSNMHPTYNVGDILACRLLLNGTVVLWNSVYVLDMEMGILVKRIRPGSSELMLCLFSDNPGYDPIEISRLDIRHMAIVLGGIRTE